MLFWWIIRDRFSTLATHRCSCSYGANWTWWTTWANLLLCSSPGATDFLSIVATWWRTWEYVVVWTHTGSRRNLTRRKVKFASSLSPDCGRSEPIICYCSIYQLRETSTLLLQCRIGKRRKALRRREMLLPSLIWLWQKIGRFGKVQDSNMIFCISTSKRAC